MLWILNLLPNVTSSPESEDGLLPSDLPESHPTPDSGPGAAPASHSLPQGKDSEPPTNGTSGPCGSSSSKPADHHLSSENKSPARLSSEELQRRVSANLEELLRQYGSMEYSLTLKDHLTPARRQIFRLRASARRTSDNDCSGWPTPRANGSTEDHESLKSRSPKNGTNLEAVAQLTGRPTPNAHDGRRPGCDLKSTQGGNLSRDAHLAGWSTPMAGTPAQNGNNAAGNNDFSRMVVGVMSGWGTPRVTTNSGNGSAERSTDGLSRLEDQVHGAITESSSAGMESTAVFQLNPRFSLWLMGYPTSWHDAGASALRSLRDQETPSSRKQRRSSSELL